MEVAIATIVAIATGVIGYLISLWRNRTRPWISLVQFGESNKLDDEVELTEELTSASMESWFAPGLPEDRALMRDISAVNTGANKFIDRNMGTPERYESSLSQLEAASEPESVMKALELLLEDHGITDALESALYAEYISIPDYDRSVEPQIKYYSDEKTNDGCFQVPLASKVFYLGDDLNVKHYRKDSIMPFVELLVRLEKDQLVKVFKELLPLWKRQLSVNTLIVKEAGKIRDDYSRWSCGLSITNFGALPFILFPDEAELFVSGADINRRLPCRILTVDEDGDPHDIPGVAVLHSGTTENLAIITKSTQLDITNVEYLKTAYAEGDAVAYARVRALGREIPWKRWKKSTPTPFRSKM